ncbi:hypothetical protein ZOSMA_85G00150 [Zostera marina]|uniref:Uncharacterized protein n=1 Tax=Zostera marina TaxID=29655 RepID=A0A0K9NLG1_ZOSMR|nr:hypothetical protein ZOSMA_85G00150 [Zostera marina]
MTAMLSNASLQADTNPTTNPARNVDRVSVETLNTTSPVRASVSKNPTSCRRTASKYRFRSALTCLSPVYIQQDISVKKGSGFWSSSGIFIQF